MLYHRGWGRYSPQRLSQRGAVLGTRDNFRDMSKYQPMDLFFLHPRGSFLSWLVMYYTNGIWSHVGSFAENGLVVDATTGGVIKHHFYDYCDGSTYILIIRLPTVTDAQRLKAAQFIQNQVGKGYNWSGVMRLFLYIVSGNKYPYRFRFFLDFLFIAVIVGLLGLAWSPLIWVSALTMSGYMLIVSINIIRRRFGNSKMFDGRIMDLKYEFYIAAKPEDVWKVLVSPIETKKIYYGNEIQSTFKIGSPLRYVKLDKGGAEIDYIHGKILEFQPYKIFSHSLKVGETYGGANHVKFESRVTYALEPIGSCTKLTLTHDQWTEGDLIHASSASSWWVILSAIKTLVETGKTLNL
jgi:hypothetical protein